jgi:hypothetical protein
MYLGDYRLQICKLVGVGQRPGLLPAVVQVVLEVYIPIFLEYARKKNGADPAERNVRGV